MYAARPFIEIRRASDTTTHKNTTRRASAPRPPPRPATSLKRALRRSTTPRATTSSNLKLGASGVLVGRAGGAHFRPVIRRLLTAYSNMYDATQRQPSNLFFHDESSSNELNIDAPSHLAGCTSCRECRGVIQCEGFMSNRDGVSPVKKWIKHGRQIKARRGPPALPCDRALRPQTLRRRPCDGIDTLGNTPTVECSSGRGKSSANVLGARVIMYALRQPTFKSWWGGGVKPSIYGHEVSWCKFLCAFFSREGSGFLERANAAGATDECTSISEALA
ncbi:hypothetical protein EVAR_48402_1 [Eumeta japonica]|uniref:Uncharacterized protein n=1 Tax=Eumeta variegata TaxID=151549 RepID=A0A4C1XPF4_EUMVA|nr:hypothetical protein EVAR_48402_1 [Eumeta japonica]